MTGALDPTIRRARPDDGVVVGDVWLASWRATFDFPPGHPDDDVRRWLAEELIPRHETWVAEAPDGRVVALMALSDTMVEQLYVSPEWIGRGIGRRMIELAMERRPAGLDLYCFQANARARAFYEHLGFVAIAFGDGSGNEEHQPDIRYAWRPSRPGPDLEVGSADGTAIAAFRSGLPEGPPLVLVHGAAADHTTFRVIGPLLGTRFDVYAIDRRGRGASGDTLPYAIEREFEDVVAVAEAVAAARGARVIDVVGHSYGGRCALGAALRTDTIRRIVSYEGAPTPPHLHYSDPAVVADLARLDEAGRHDELLETFMRRIVGMDDAALAAYRADPVWPARVAAAPTIVRELGSEESDVAGLEALRRVRQPVLQVVGGDSIAEFVESTRALAHRLADGRVVIIPGARHGAHHTHPNELVAAVAGFLTDGM